MNKWEKIVLVLCVVFVIVAGISLVIEANVFERLLLFWKSL